MQKRATKLVQGIGAWKYDDRLQYLGLSRLDKRRARSDVVETFKIINGVYDINSEYFSNLMLAKKGIIIRNCSKSVLDLI